MSFLTRLRSVFYGPSDSLGDGAQGGGWLIRAIGGAPTKAGVQVSEYTALHLPVVYACINRISNPIATFPLGIFQRLPNGDSKLVEDHPLSQRLGTRPNDFMSSRTLRKTCQAHALTWGNGYLEIERNGKGQAVNLWPLLPAATRPRFEDGELHYCTTIDGTPYDVDANNVVHIMDQSHDGYIGRSPIWVARQAIGLGLAMEEYGAKFFANDAKSGGFLMHPGKLGSVGTQNLEASMNGGGPAAARYTEQGMQQRSQRTGPGAALERQGGLENAHRIKVLEEGMKFVPTTIPPEDAQFLGSREFQIAEIARIYDVPLILLQSHEKSTSWGSGVEQLMIGFVTQTVSPWIGAWEQELDWKLFTEEERAKGYYVKFNMNAILRGDMAARSAFYKTLVEIGAMTRNEVRRLEEYDRIEGLDEPTLPVNWRLASEPHPAAAPAAAPSPSQPQDQAA
jgi:phage portal protein BeeE